MRCRHAGSTSHRVVATITSFRRAVCTRSFLRPRTSRRAPEPGVEPDSTGKVSAAIRERIRDREPGRADARFAFRFDPWQPASRPIPTSLRERRERRDLPADDGHRRPAGTVLAPARRAAGKRAARSRRTPSRCRPGTRRSPCRSSTRARTASFATRRRKNQSERSASVPVHVWNSASSRGVIVTRTPDARRTGCWRSAAVRGSSTARRRSRRYLRLRPPAAQEVLILRAEEVHVAERQVEPPVRRARSSAARAARPGRTLRGRAAPAGPSLPRCARGRARRVPTAGGGPKNSRLWTPIGSRMRPDQSGCSRCHAPRMCMAASTSTGSMTTRGSGFDRNQRSRGCTSSVPSMPSLPTRSSDADHLEQRPVEHVSPQVLDRGLARHFVGEAERLRRRRVGVAVGEDDDRLGRGLVRAVAEERVAEVADVGLHFDDAGFGIDARRRSRALRALSARGRTGASGTGGRCGSATTTLPGASSDAASAIASRLNVIGRTGSPFWRGIDAADAAAAERVVVGVQVFALVHHAAEDDLAARLEVFNVGRRARRPSFRDVCRVSSSWSGRSRAMSKKSSGRFAGAVRPARNASITSRCTSRNCSITAR